MPRRFRRLIHRWARFCLVAGAFLFVAETRATAACGNHGVVSFQTIETSSPPKKAAVSNLISYAQSSTRHCGECPVAPDPVPCRGLFCSGQPAPAAVPVTAGAPRAAPEMLSVDDATRTLKPNRHADWLKSAAPSLAIPRTDFIFHPPRHG